MKILHNPCLHFARQDGQGRKKRIENHATKVIKIPKTKRQKYGMNETKAKTTYFLQLYFPAVVLQDCLERNALVNSCDTIHLEKEVTVRNKCTMG